MIQLTLDAYITKISHSDMPVILCKKYKLHKMIKTVCIITSKKSGIKDLEPNISTPNQFYNSGQLAG
jgi:hypothetical protein